MANILVVDDEDSIRTLIQLALSFENHTIMEAADGKEALQVLDGELQPDLILLDVMLPEIDGFSLMHQIESLGIPVIFLSARNSVQDKVMGLKLGADDYIVKPFEPIELNARIEAVLRRHARQSPSDQPVLHYKDLVLDPCSHTITWNRQVVDLTEKEFELLRLLMSHPGQTFTREQILDSVWGYAYYGTTRTVDIHIKELRRKLPLKEDIATVFKVGYRLNKEDHA